MKAPVKWKILWLDRERDPKCAPNPEYPNGKDIDLCVPGIPGCKTDLPYPAKRCGMFYVECRVCGSNALITTAGRPDDPRSVKLDCKRNLQ